MFTLLLLQSPEQAKYHIISYKHTDLSRLSRELGVIFTPPLTILTSSVSYKPVPAFDPRALKTLSLRLALLPKELALHLGRMETPQNKLDPYIPENQTDTSLLPPPDLETIRRQADCTTSVPFPPRFLFTATWPGLHLAVL